MGESSILLHDLSDPETPRVTLLPFHTTMKAPQHASGLPLHPSVNSGITKGDPKKAGGKMYCKCSDPGRIEVSLGSNVAHNHACGCSKCWKPDGALFSVVGVIPCESLRVTRNQEKLRVVDKSAVIQRYACKDCGVHMFGRIEQDHAFKGLDFVHVELSDEDGWQEPQFAAFVSSVVEGGFDPQKMLQVRSHFQSVGLETYDCLSPALMDLVAAHSAKSLARL